MYYNPQQQPYNNNPIGNILPIGFPNYNNQYNNGMYYNQNNFQGGYNTYLNPYYVRKQQELQIAQQREEARREADHMKKLYMMATSFLGEEVTEDDLNRFNPDYNINYNLHEDNLEGLDYEERKEYYTLLERERIKSNNQNYITYNANKFVEFENRSMDIHFMNMQKNKIPNDVGLVEYLRDYAPKIMTQVFEEERKKKERDLTAVYNRVDYNKLIARHKDSNSPSNMQLFGSALNPNMGYQIHPDASISDMEIKLPHSISDATMQERRARFLQSIMGGKSDG